MSTEEIRCRQKTIALMSEYVRGTREADDPLQAAYEDFVEWCKIEGIDEAKYRDWFEVPSEVAI